MPAPTYTLIASSVLGTSASTVTFSSIPATYRDLVLVINYSAFFSGANITLNNDTGNTNYTSVEIRGNGTNATSVSNTGVAYFLQTFSSTDGDNHIIQILDYSATDKHKTGLSRLNSATSTVRAVAARWANTAAINKIDLIGNSGNEFSSGTSFYLYGIVS